MPCGCPVAISVFHGLRSASLATSLTSRALISGGCAGTASGSGIPASSRRGRFLTAGAFGGGSTMSGALPARAPSAFMQPASCGRPVASRNGNASQMRRPGADRLSKDSRERMAAMRAIAAPSPGVRLIRDCVTGSGQHAGIALSGPMFVYMAGVGNPIGIEVTSRLAASGH